MTTIAILAFVIGFVVGAIPHIRRLDRDMARRQEEPPVVVRMRIGG